MKDKEWKNWAKRIIESYRTIMVYENHIFLYNGISPHSMVELETALILLKWTLGYKTIICKIFSPGGSALAMNAFLDFIEVFKEDCKFITIACGLVASAAVDIFLSGDTRIIMPSSFLLIHEAYQKIQQGHVNTRMWYRDAWIESSFIETLCKQYYHFIGQWTYLNASEIENIISREDSILNANDAVITGFAHKIYGFKEYELMKDTTILFKNNFLKEAIKWIKSDDKYKFIIRE